MFLGTAALMNPPRRSLALLFGAFAIALLTGFGVGASWLVTSRFDQPEDLGSPAGGGNAPEIAFEGIVHFVSGGHPATWLVDVYSVQVVTSTQVFSNGLSTALGAWAQVEAVKADEGLQATTIALRAAPTSALYDEIKAIYPLTHTLKVGSTMVEIEPGTDIQGTPEVGSLAMVTGKRSAGGIAADAIVVAAAEPDTILVGTLRAISPTSWLVDDVAVQIDATTDISGTPSLGLQVQVQGIETGPQSMAATRAWVAHDGIEQQQWIGWLQRIEGQGYPYLWRINRLDGPRFRQVYVSVYEDVVLDDSARAATPGAWLDVAALRQAESVYRAQSIVVLPRAPKMAIVGLVETLPPGGFAGRWRIGGYLVEVTGQTGIIGAPAVGSLVWVQGIPDTAAILHAEQITVQGN